MGVTDSEPEAHLEALIAALADRQVDGVRARIQALSPGLCCDDWGPGMVFPISRVTALALDPRIAALPPVIPSPLRAEGTA